MMLRENSARKTVIENEYFKDNKKLIREEIVRVKAITDREEKLCEELDEILPKL